MVQWLRICTDFAEFGFNCLKLQLQENSMPLQAPTHEYTIKKINLPKICCRKMKTTIATKSTVRHEGEFVCVYLCIGACMCTFLGSKRTSGVLFYYAFP